MSCIFRLGQGSGKWSFLFSLSVHGNVRRKERGRTVWSTACRFIFIFESVNRLTKLLAQSCS